MLVRLTDLFVPVVASARLYLAKKSPFARLGPGRMKEAKQTIDRPVLSRGLLRQALPSSGAACVLPLEPRPRASRCNREQQGAERLRRARQLGWRASGFSPDAVEQSRVSLAPGHGSLAHAAAQPTERRRKRLPCCGVRRSRRRVAGRAALHGAVQAVRGEALPARPFFCLTVRVSWSILRLDYKRSRCWRCCRPSGKRISARRIPWPWRAGRRRQLGERARPVPAGAEEPWHDGPGLSA